jgi:uncharacterized protein YbjT (DUF2867 family)
MRAFLDMARRGRTYLVGDGAHRINPISGRDVAAVSVDAAEAGSDEVEVGGPDVFSYAQIAQLAARAAGRPARVTHLPPGVLRATVGALRRLTPASVHGPLEFLLAVMTTDMVAPAVGRDRLGDYFAQQAAQAELRPR